MPLTYSISMVLCFGLLNSVVSTAVAGRWREIHPVIWIVAALAAEVLVLKMG